MNKELDLFDIFAKVLENNSTVSLILITVSMCIWFIGGNLVDRTCAKRLGLSPYELPAFSFKHYNEKEKTYLLCLFLSAFILGAIGLFSS